MVNVIIFGPQTVITYFEAASYLQSLFCMFIYRKTYVCFWRSLARNGGEVSCADVRKSKIPEGQCTKIRFQRKHPVRHTETLHGVVGLLLVKGKQFFSNDKQISDVVLIYFQRDATLHSLFISGKLLYMFRVASSPIIRSTYNCIYSIWYLLTVRGKNKLLVICI